MALLSNRKFFWHKSNFSTNLSTAISIFCLICVCVCVCVTQEHFKCAYDYTCKMDLSNRRFCKRCRLGKCFQIGMRREYILSDDERAIKRQKIIENRSHLCLGDDLETVLYF